MLTSWAQRDKPLQETVTFMDKKKIAYNYSDPGGTLPQKLRWLDTVVQGQHLLL